MSKIYKISLSDELAEELERRAGGQKVQDYIRHVLFPEEFAITPAIALELALEKYKQGDLFSVPEIFDGSDTYTWNLPNGIAGQFGRKFAALITETAAPIRWTGDYNAKGHAVYERL
jgi:hypothetical protein